MNLYNSKKVKYIAETMQDRLIDASRNDISAPRAIHDAMELVIQLAQLDPHPPKSLQFLAVKYANREFRLEDAQRVRSAIEEFYRRRATLAITDIYKYKSLHDLYDAVETTDDSQNFLSKREQKRQVKTEGTELFLEAENFQVIRLITGEAAELYARGTKWCTSQASVFMNYAKQGDIYVIIVLDPSSGEYKKFQFHYQSGQVANAQDRPLTAGDIALLSSYSAWYDFIDAIIRRHYVKLKEE